MATSSSSSQTIEDVTQLARSPAQDRATAIYCTPLGSMYVGDAASLLADDLHHLAGSVQLLFTSPPFPLIKKKTYGNLQGDKYVEWLSQFASTFKRMLTPDGSIVLELGNAWEPGRPTMSTLPARALLGFLEAADLHLCEELVCYNPAKLPTPAQWVNIERIRVKDAYTRLWWMSPVARPKADNRAVLKSYSKSMIKLLASGAYNYGRRPSQHVVGQTSFLADNGGAISPNVILPELEELVPDTQNLLPVANTRSDDPYQNYCRAYGIEPHPARMPESLVEFFVRFLTSEDDLVLDPFAGSNTTGWVAQHLGRRWVSIETKEDYARASQSRFGLVRKP